MQFDAKRPKFGILCTFFVFLFCNQKKTQRKYQRNDGSTASVIEVMCDSVQFLEPKGTRGGYEEVPPFDDAPVQNEEDSRNLDSIDLPDDDLPF